MHASLLHVVGVSIVISPLSVNVIVNETVSLTCMASGFPLPSIRWNHDQSGVSSLLGIHVSNESTAGADASVEVPKLHNKSH